MNTEMHLRLAEIELARRHGRADGRDDAVGRADHQPVVDRGDALGVAEEIGAPGGQDRADPEQAGGERAQDDGSAGEGGDERPSFPVDGDEGVSDRILNAHARRRVL
jgi:hypothetical protein